MFRAAISEYKNIAYFCDMNFPYGQTGFAHSSHKKRRANGGGGGIARAASCSCSPHPEALCDTRYSAHGILTSMPKESDGNTYNI